MIKFLSAVVFFAGVAAQAMPAIGDKSSLTMTVSNGTQSVTYGYEMSLTGFDAALSQYTRHTVQSYNGQSQERDDAVAATDLLDDARLQAILTNCDAGGGTTESVTVPAGTFSTCKIVTEDGSEYWIGNVPFGIVKMAQAANGYTLSAELQSYVFGQ